MREHECSLSFIIGVNMPYKVCFISDCMCAEKLDNRGAEIISPKIFYKGVLKGVFRVET